MANYQNPICFIDDTGKPTGNPANPQNFSNYCSGLKDFGDNVACDGFCMESGIFCDYGLFHHNIKLHISLLKRFLKSQSKP